MTDIDTQIDTIQSVLEKLWDAAQADVREEYGDGYTLPEDMTLAQAHTAIKRLVLKGRIAEAERAWKSPQRDTLNRISSLEKEMEGLQG